MTKGYTRVPHLILESNISLEEKMMLWFLLDKENRLMSEGKWFNLCDEDFIEVGYGKNKSRWRKHRDGLISKGLIEFKKGGPGRKSRYHIAENLEEILMQYIGTLKIEDNKVVGAEYKGKPDNKPSTEIRVMEEKPTTPAEEPKVDERKLWMEAIKDETWKWGRGRQDIFNNYWWKYYINRSEALEEVKSYLKNNKVFASIV